MRLRRLDLTRYGKFTDYSLNFGEPEEGRPDLHIVYGLNEAGKSTAFSAYLDFLFGIPERSSYNFLHSYDTMQVGAAVEIDGAVHDLVRLKKRSGSLVDRQGRPANEALLSSALGGISRDAYRAMFSLDDQSLKDGGNAILESRGELGEMLFSASSGLAGLSHSLAGADEEALSLHKKRASSTRLAELKRELEKLKEERNAVDTAAAHHRQLKAEHERASQAYEAAMAELGAVRMQIDEARRLNDALPLAADIDRLEAELAARGEAPKPPAEWFARLPQLMQAETRLQALLQSAAGQCEALEKEIAEIEVDEAGLALAGRIAELERHGDRYRTASEDLPKRRAALAEQEAVLTARLRDLGEPDHSEPVRLILPAPLVERLRDLIESRSGFETALQAAESECERARLAYEKARAGAGDDAAPVDADTLGALERALAIASASDLPGRLTAEERACVAADATLQKAMRQLAPWISEPEELAGVDVPEDYQLRALKVQAEAADKALADTARRLRELNAELRRIEARLEALKMTGAIDDQSAREVRSARDAAWARHLEALDRTTAEAFETAMRRDDVLSAERLSRASEIAELRQLEQQRAERAADVESLQVHLTDEREKADAVAAKLIAFLPDGIDRPETLPELAGLAESWAVRLETAIAALDARHQAERLRDGVASQLAALIRDVAAALAKVGIAADDDATLPQLIELGNRQLARQRALAESWPELKERERALEKAGKAMGEWEAAWRAALAETWFAGKADAVTAVRAILDTLADLPAILNECDQLSQRIDTMERDRHLFAVEVAALYGELGIDMPADISRAVDVLVARKEAALSARQRKAGKERDLADAVARRQNLEEDWRVHAAERAEITEFFGTDTLNAVSSALDAIRERERLEERIAQLKADLMRGLRLSDYNEARRQLEGVDAPTLERRLAELSARAEDLEKSRETAFADLTAAQKALDAVGSDDAAARIEARRRTVLLEIEDVAQRYLLLRVGTRAASEALHVYRENHRSSMMKRASKAFRLITGGAYSGLTTRPDRDQEILIGIDRNGGSKLARDMSTGTQFQLYLALRLAGYEEIAAVRPSVPFVADDIMESFDNPRSEEVFRLLGAMANTGQVIYLTHHWHLCEIARAVVPNVTIHMLP